MALVLLTYLLAVWQLWFLTDDAFISFRYAHNLASGQGLCFNPGQPPVEGFSNLLWVLLATIFEALGADTPLWMRVVSVCCGLGVLLRVQRIARHDLALPGPLPWVVTAFLALLPPFVVWSSGGLETMAFTLALLACVELLTLRDRPGWAALAGLAVALLRVEGLAWVAVLVALDMVRRRLLDQPTRRAPLCLALTVLGSLPWWGVRLLWFGDGAANSAFAKLGALGVDPRGLGYVAGTLLAVPTLAWVLPGAWMALRSPARRPLGVVLVGLALGFPVWAAVVGGDFMAMGRLLVPGLPFMALLFGWVLAELWGRSWLDHAATVGVVAVSIVLGGLSAFDLNLAPLSLRHASHMRYNLPHYTSEIGVWEIQRDNAERWSRMGRALGARFGADDSLVMGAVGAVGYYSQMQIYDRFALVRRHPRPHPPDIKRRSPGHDLAVPISYFLPDAPTVLEVKLARNRHKLRSTFDNLERRLTKHPDVHEHYVTDFFAAGSPRFVVMWRRLDGERDAQEALIRARLAQALR